MKKLPSRGLGKSITDQGEQGNVGPKHWLRINEPSARLCGMSPDI